MKTIKFYVTFTYLFVYNLLGCLFTNFKKISLQNLFLF